MKKSKPKTEVEMKLWHDSGNILRHIVLYLCSDNEGLKNIGVLKFSIS